MMKRERVITSIFFAAALAAGVAVTAQKPASAPAAGTQKAAASYAVTGSVKLGGEGPWGHVALDADAKLLYVMSTDWLRVMDAATQKTVAEFGVGNGARGVTLVPETGRGFVSSGWGQTVTVFDLKTNKVLGSVKFDHETEAITYDPMSKHMLLCLGDGHSLVPFAPDMDLKSGKTDPPIDLDDGVPEALVPDGHGMVYVTLVDKDRVAVVDTRKMKLVTTWPLAPGSRPMGISMDERHSRLFVGCRSGVVVLSATDGHELATVPVNGGVDATAFFDEKIFASSENGTFTVIAQNPAGRFEIQQSLQTGCSGANMNGSTPNNAMVMNPKSGAIYLPASEVPRRGGGPRFKLLILEKR